jgi:hypothetical protein
MHVLHQLCPPKLFYISYVIGEQTNSASLIYTYKHKHQHIPAPQHSEYEKKHSLSCNGHGKYFIQGARPVFPLEYIYCHQTYQSQWNRWCNCFSILNLQTEIKTFYGDMCAHEFIYFLQCSYYVLHQCQDGLEKTNQYAAMQYQAHVYHILWMVYVQILKVMFDYVFLRNMLRNKKLAMVRYI